MSHNAAELRESIAAVALTHDKGCECMICEASRGDEDALAAVEVQASLGRFDEAVES